MTSISKVAPFLAPFAVFMLFLGCVDGYLPDQHYLLYPIKCALVAGVIAFYWRELPSLRPTALSLSIVIGVIGVVLWIGLDVWSVRLDAVLGEGWNRVVASVGLNSWKTATDTAMPVGRDPFQLYPPAEAWALFALRLAGIALVVPIMEELFWRGFLMRWLIQEDFTAVPLGTYQAFSFCITTLFFASVHGYEWPQGMIVGTIYGAWFVRTKSLGSIMVAHGTTNFLLALYCLYSSDWHFLSTVNSVQLPK